MTNRIALSLALLLAAATLIDLLVFGDRHLVFLGKKLFALIHWTAFWR